MLKQFQKKEIKDNSHLRPYTWRDSWIRPYESLYSVFNTFKSLNVFYSDVTAVSILSNNRCRSITSQLTKSLYNNPCEKKINGSYSCKGERVIAEAFSGNIENNKFPYFNEKAMFLIFSNRYKHCPLCDKIGYHSWLYQHKQLKVCPIHNTPLIDGEFFPLMIAKNVPEQHPSLNKVDTTPIEAVYKRILGNVSAIKAININSFFHKDNLFNLQTETIWDVGEEVCCESTDKIHNVKDELARQFIHLVKALHEYIRCEFGHSIYYNENSEYYGYRTDVKTILDAIFREKEGHRRDNPTFIDTYAVELQVYISIMEIMMCEDLDNDLFRHKDLFYQYICEIFAYQNPFDFRRIFKPGSGLLTWYNRTPAFIEENNAEYDSSAPRLNDNYLYLRCIDDHVKYQWDYIKTHFKRGNIELDHNFVSAYNPGENKKFNDLPHLMYLIVTDSDNINHVLRLIE